MTSVEIGGKEEEEFDQQVQDLVTAGFRIIDKALVIDPTVSPPVWGWILYREMTHADQPAARRSHRASAETNGEWFP